MQRGKYVVGRSGDERLANNGGWMTKFTGTSSDNLNAPDQLLIAFLFVGPDFSPSTTSHQTYLSSLDVETPTANFTIEWDRNSQVVNIHGAKYDRTDGNIFIVRMNGGDISARQIETIQDSDKTNDILTAVKNALPNDTEIQALAARSNK